MHGFSRSRQINIFASRQTARNIYLRLTLTESAHTASFHSGSLESNGVSFLPPKRCTRYSLRVEYEKWRILCILLYLYIVTCTIEWYIYVCARPFALSLARTIRANHSSSCHLVLCWPLAFHVNRTKLYQKTKLVRDWDRTSLPFVFKNSTSDTGNKSSLIPYLLLQRTAVLSLYV